ncbi:GNAT family N-acetyltransferase [Fictibacillus sp. BK138]|uniref:GNAT family N-acetyltransferase n=1 Tax=Fictibacillus sp. BK138 TaxID=2512121 RepID=UPI0010296B31|nr:GNAT family protein [Fictibacillus sp. BK138]RZT15523.1 RimJ/RimL family protein N-acetyltransferase [Fictibacillus sp. BK138]
MEHANKLLEGNKIYLRPLEQSDKESIYLALTNEEVRKMTGSKKVFTREQINGYYDRISSDDSRVDLTICTQEDDEVVGDISILEINPLNRNAYIRVALNEPKYFGRGYGSEAMKLMVKFGFQTLNLHRIELNVYSFNERGIKTYEKLGFKKEGVQREALFYEGQYHDSIIMGILESEFIE